MPGQDDIERALDAILSIESSRNYATVGPTHPTYGRALGGFQVMERNLPGWLRDAGMADMTPEAFLANPEAQRQLFRHRFGMYANRYGLEGASRAWFAGEGGMNDPNRRDVFGTTVSEYARRFNERLGGRNVAGPGTELETTNVNVPDMRNQPEQPTSWTQWLSSPTNRAFLMSAGAQMAQPGWGNAASNFSLALAQGGAAQAETGNKIAEEERKRMELQSGEVQGELNRRSMERRTAMATESRLDVAGLRANAMLERARLIGLRGTGQQNEYMRTVRALYSTLLQNNPAAMTDATLQERLFNQALEQAERTYREQMRIQGQPTGDQRTPPGQAAPPPADELAGVVDRGNRTPGTQRQPPTQLVNPGVNQPAPNADRTVSWEQFIATSRGQQAVRNPEVRGRLLAQRPHWAAQIQAWMDANGVQ